MRHAPCLRPYAKEKENFICLHFFSETNKNLSVDRKKPFASRTENNIVTFKL